MAMSIPKPPKPAKASVLMVGTDRWAVRLPALSSSRRAGVLKVPLAQRRGSASGDGAARHPYQNDADSAALCPYDWAPLN